MKKKALQPVHRGLRPVSMEDGILASALALTSTRREVRFGSVWSIGQSCRALNSSFTSLSNMLFLFLTCLIIYDIIKELFRRRWPMGQSCGIYSEELYRQVTPGTMLVFLKGYSVRVYYSCIPGAFDWRTVVYKHRPCWRSVAGGEQESEPYKNHHEFLKKPTPLNLVY